MRVFITGASRGIGGAVARVFAERHPGAQIALVARSLRTPLHEGLRGTLAEVARDVERCGGVPLALEADLKCADEVTRAAKTALGAFGGMDVLINGASVLDLARTPKSSRIKLVTDVNVAGTVHTTQTLLEALRESSGSVVTIAPPIDLARPEWIWAHPHFTISKYAMTILALGIAHDKRIRSNTLWPERTIATSASKRIEKLVPGAFSRGRDPREFATCVYSLAISSRSGQTLLDSEVCAMADSQAPKHLFVA